jgi:hypothetical protein
VLRCIKAQNELRSPCDCDYTTKRLCLSAELVRRLQYLDQYWLIFFAKMHNDVAHFASMVNRRSRGTLNAQDICIGIISNLYGIFSLHISIYYLAGMMIDTQDHSFFLATVNLVDDFVMIARSD